MGPLKNFSKVLKKISNMERTPRRWCYHQSTTQNFCFWHQTRGEIFFFQISQTQTGDNTWRSQNPTAPASDPAKASRVLGYLGINGIYTCGNQLLKSLAVTMNPPSFTLKPNTRKQERTKGKMAFCAMSECWWEGHSLNITSKEHRKPNCFYKRQNQHSPRGQSTLTAH